MPTCRKLDAKIIHGNYIRKILVLKPTEVNQLLAHVVILYAPPSIYILHRPTLTFDFESVLTARATWNCYTTTHHSHPTSPGIDPGNSGGEGDDRVLDALTTLAGSEGTLTQEKFLN